MSDMFNYSRQITDGINTASRILYLNIDVENTLIRMVAVRRNGVGIFFSKQYGCNITIADAQNSVGPQGEQGETGLAPNHQWSTTHLRFQNPDGS
jgi:hypothetical protein